MKTQRRGRQETAADLKREIHRYKNIQRKKRESSPDKVSRKWRGKYTDSYREK